MLAMYILIFGHHVNMQLIKIPTTSYVNATLKRWGHDFLSIRGGIFKPLIQWGKAKCQGENPSSYQPPFLSYSPNHLFMLEIGWGSYCMGMGRVWQSKFELEKPSIFGKHDFDFWGKLTPKNACPFCCSPTSSISSRSGSLESSLLHVFLSTCAFSLTWAAVFFIFPHG